MPDRTFDSQTWAADLAQKAIGQENQGYEALGTGINRAGSAIGEGMIRARQQNIEEQHFQSELGLQREHLDIARRGADLAQQKFQQDKLESTAMIAEREANTKEVMRRLQMLGAVNEQQKAALEMQLMREQVNDVVSQRKLREAQAAAAVPRGQAQDAETLAQAQVALAHIGMQLNPKTGKPEELPEEEVNRRTKLTARTTIGQNYAMFARSAEQAMDMDAANFYENLSNQVLSGAIEPAEAAKQSAARRAGMANGAAPKGLSLNPSAAGAAKPATSVGDTLRTNVPKMIDGLRILTPEFPYPVPAAKLQPAARNRLQQFLAPQIQKTIAEAEAQFGTEDSGDKRVQDAVQRFLDGLQTTSWQKVLASKIDLHMDVGAPSPTQDGTSPGGR